MYRSLCSRKSKESQPHACAEIYHNFDFFQYSISPRKINPIFCIQYNGENVKTHSPRVSVISPRPKPPMYIHEALPVLFRPF